MSMRTTVIVLAAAAVLMLAACGADTTESTAAPATDGSTTSVADSAPVPSDPAQPTAPVAAGDASGGDEVSDPIDPSADVSGGTVSRWYEGGSQPPELAGIIGQAIADLAERLGIDEDAVAVALVQEVTWGDASLGCPQPGMRYTQVVTDGMRIVLEADDAFYDYRADGVRAPFLCEQPPLAEEGSTPLLEIKEDGSVVTIAPPPSKGGVPTETITPPGT